MKFSSTPAPTLSRVSFSVKSSGKQQFEGVGICRWNRTEAQFGLPRGMGIEFESLTDESLQVLSGILKQRHTKAFIPKTCGL